MQHTFLKALIIQCWKCGLLGIDIIDTATFVSLKHTLQLVVMLTFNVRESDFSKSYLRWKDVYGPFLLELPQ